MSAVLQNLFTQPRDRKNSRYARENHIQRAIDSKHPNISYNLIDKQDYHKFHVLNDEEVELERVKSKELSRKLVSTWQGRPGSAPVSGTGGRSQSRQKFIPPKLGTMSKSAKKDARAWEKSIQQASSTGTTSSNGHHTGRSANRGSNNTIKRLAGNSMRRSVSTYDDNDDAEDMISPKPSASISSKHDGHHNNDEDLMTVVEVMTSKFIQNIQVIDKLYEEKKSMEQRIRSLEKQVSRISGHSVHDDVEDAEDMDDVEEKKILSHDDEDDDDKKIVHPRHARSSTSSSRPRSASNPSASNPSASSHRAITPRTFNISPSLQADLERHNQRMEIARNKEQERELLQKEYDLIQKEKLMRASMNSNPGIDRMLERQASLRESSQQKKERLQQQLVEEKIAEERERRRLRLEQLNKPIIKHEVDWKDYAAIEEVKRKQRIEQRKQELTSSMQMTSSASAARIDDLARPRSASSASLGRRQSSSYKPFKATEDPAKIADKLQRRQQAWDEKLSRTKDNIRHTLSERQASSHNLSSLVKSMHDRAEHYDKKRHDRVTIRQQHEEEEKQLKIEEEKKKREKLFQAKIPDTGRRLTNAAELRAMKVRETIEKEAEMAQKKMIDEEKKMKMRRETSAVMRTIVEQRDYERKQRVGGFVELRDVEEIAAQKSAEKRKDMRDKMRKQRRELEEAKSRQPSLIERYEQDQAKRTGQQDALQKVASAARVGGKSNNNDSLDIFSEKEKLLLQL